MIQMDLNADIGEIDGEAGRALDRKILDVVTSCNIACGGHAGDENSMKATLTAAGERGVSTGAHPSYPDRENFGRVSLSIPAEILKDSLIRQVQSLVSTRREVFVWFGMMRRVLVLGMGFRMVGLMWFFVG